MPTIKPPAPTTVGPTKLPSYVKDLESNMPARKMTPVVQQPRVPTPPPARIPTRQVMSGSAGTSKPTMLMAAAKGGKVKSASARADGCCIRGKTRA
jgi:hypothetical protein